MSNLELEIERLKKRLEIIETNTPEIRQYYQVQRDETARQAKKANPVSNLDENNLVILEAELENLLRGNNPTPQERQRIQELRVKIAHLKNDPQSQSGNPNTRQRPDRD